jgi:PAS domain S-box-containing protein
VSRRRQILAASIVVMACVSLGGVGVAIPTLYRAAFDAERSRLRDIVRSRVSLIEAVARFDGGAQAGPSSQSASAGATDAASEVALEIALDAAAAETTLRQVVEAHAHFEGFGETGEFTVARRAGDEIVFLVSQRHAKQATPQAVTWTSAVAEPMRRALSGLSGTLVGLDYRGETVLAAHEPIPGLRWGVVAKIDLAEVQAPFVRAGVLATGLAAVLVIAGAAVVVRLMSPLLRGLEARTAELREANEQLGERVARRTEALEAANARLEVEVRDRERAQETTRESLTRARAVLDTAVDAIITIDEHGVIESVNAAAAQMFGYEAAELCGFNVSRLIPEPFGSAHDGYIQNYLRSGERKIIGIGREVPCLRKDGKVFPGDLAVSEILLDDRRLFTGVLRDLSERKRVEKELQDAAKRVEAAEELASVGTLVAGLAHEIGTPMGVIQGHAKLLEKHIDNESARWRLKTIQDQIGRISRIIQSLLNMARPKATERVLVALEPLLETTLSFLTEKLSRRRVRVVRDFQQVGSVIGDPERLQQLLLNLFLNAVDAMPDGGELRVRLQPDGKSGVILWVGDTGYGIEPDKLDRIFDAFYTSKEAGSGNGLGLMVASRIVGDHGGTLRVESTLGVGTEFRIHLPWNPQ